MRQRIANDVDVETIQLRLPTEPPERVDQYFKFGQILFSEMLSRNADVERKLLTILGWSVAALGSVWLPQRVGFVATAISYSIVGVSLIAVVLCAYALKSNMWVVPSQKDWFGENLHGSDLDVLKRYHVLCLLASHHQQSPKIARKAKLLGYAEVLLTVLALLLTCLAATRIA